MTLCWFILLASLQLDVFEDYFYKFKVEVLSPSLQENVGFQKANLIEVFT